MTASVVARWAGDVSPGLPPEKAGFPFFRASCGGCGPAGWLGLVRFDRNIADADAAAHNVERHSEGSER